ncbi:MAG TPA: hypothetical protein VG963_02950 [Polyangiaceae bacterium]|nr:hypothetical protein [Polyangiaceae bacterium]
MKRPSAGFCCLVLAYGVCFAFLAWGSAQPPLERVWELHHELRIGRTVQLAERDRRILTDALERHPGLGAALLPAGRIGILSAAHEGWLETSDVTLLRTPSSLARRLVLEVPVDAPHFPERVSLTGANFRSELATPGPGSFAFDLPPPPHASELLRLKLEGAGFTAQRAPLALRVRFEPADDAASGTPREAEEAGE